MLPVLALIGYEPKRLIIAHLMDMAGMNPLRARSMPPVANPFWSDRIRREVDLQSHRPLTLPPVPGDDAEVSRELDGEVEPLMSGQEVLQVENRGRPRSRENDASRFMEKFGTPASWAEPTRMASFRGKGGEGHGHRTEGEMPREEGEELDGAVGGGPDFLERALEKEMMTRLHQENLRLKMPQTRVGGNATIEGATVDSIFVVSRAPRRGRWSSSSTAEIKDTNEEWPSILWAAVYPSGNSNSRWPTPRGITVARSSGMAVCSL